MSVLRAGDLSVRFRPRALTVGAACLAVAAALAVVAIGSGDFPLTPAQVVEILLGGGAPSDAFIVKELRLPRVVTGLAVGAALGLGGAVFQSLVRNPLGSPDILGFTQGASSGVLVTIVVFGGGGAAVAFGAIGGGIVTGLVIMALTGRHGLHGQRLILIGIGIAAILTGVNGYLLTQAQIIDAARAFLWLAGSLNGRGWSDVVPLLIALALIVPFLVLAAARPMRMLEMGDDAAQGLGIGVERVRMGVLVAAVLAIALAAAAAGPVNFVALVAPQLARRLTRAPGPNLVPSMLMGAALLMAADLIGQRAFAGTQLPVGVVTGLIGGGYLVWLLVTERKSGRI
ncbi:FecCD family ABC transporter permease [Actinomadura flavalba]|uniref:FecCD family ABC transporter permease n=1 Tax=Actinomadura flavalba TaxID=1120938 RepID=UPI000377E05F|nr:iron chelate uptake ABC transporter family permease subunit [Actinomadura flavalba]